MTDREAVTLITGYSNTTTGRMDPADRIRYFTALSIVLELLMATLSGDALTEVTALRDASDVLAGIATAESTIDTGLPYPAPA